MVTSSVYIFQSESALIISGVLAVMLIAGMIFAAAGLSTVCFLTMIRKTEHFRQIQ